MKRFIAAACAAVALGAAPLLAQSHQPYAGLQTRAIKALSDEQIADLRAGRGMSMALPAELNGYPGPSHVIEHAEALALTPEQAAEMRRLYDSMKREAVPLGERLIAQEAALDRQFAAHTMTAAALGEATAAIGKTQGELRATHLRYHLLTVTVLTADQLRRYAALRGYDGSERRPAQRHPHAH
jgi:hypothetical protein